MENVGKWICCQIGAREHYAIPRGLHRRGMLQTLYTDIWSPPGSLWGKLPGPISRGFSGRYQETLADSNVVAFNAASLLLEADLRKNPSENSWQAIMRRNEWFQERVINHWANSNLARDESGSDLPNILFSYSFAARHLFRQARSLGYKCVLGQIDPGPEEERIVRAEAERVPHLARLQPPIPELYYSHWREECRLADAIVVNSEWSKEALLTEGIPPEKIAVIPLIYEPQVEATPERQYPEAFSSEHPLRALFLGSLNLRKGMARIIESLPHLLADLPIEIRLVGPKAIDPPADFIADPRIQWIGPVSRSEVHHHYHEADLFLFPTLSDGFGLTQLEAQSWGLPIIVTKRAGDVVHHEKTGLLLDDSSPKQIAAALTRCVQNPALLQSMNDTICQMEETRFTEEAVIAQWLELAARIAG